MSYKLSGEHEDKYELMHPSGNTFYVAKKGVNKKVIDHIKSLKPVNGYADGGMVSSMDEEIPTASEMPSSKPVDPTVGMNQQTPVQRQFGEMRERIRQGNVNLPDQVIDKMALDAVTIPLERKELAEKNAAFAEKEAAQSKYAQESVDKVGQNLGTSRWWPAGGRWRDPPLAGLAGATRGRCAASRCGAKLFRAASMSGGSTPPSDSGSATESGLCPATGRAGYGEERSEWKTLPNTLSFRQARNARRNS